MSSIYCCLFIFFNITKCKNCLTRNNYFGDNRMSKMNKNLSLKFIIFFFIYLVLNRQGSVTVRIKYL